MAKHNNWIVYDGDIVAGDQPVVPAVSRGLMYGDGIFETFRTYAGQTFLLDKHLQRLFEGMSILGLQDESHITSGIRLLVDQLLGKNNLADTDAIVRLQVWRGGARGYHPTEDAGTHFSITASACPDTFANPSLATVSHRRIPSEALPSTVKFTNGINYILAAREAAEQGGDDALMQTVGGWISETTIANVFWAKGSTIFTPSTNCDLIPGITRRVVINLIEGNSSWKLQEGQFELDHLLDADVAWICNSVREVLPVRKVDFSSFSVGNLLFSDLKQAFSSYRNANLKPLDG